MYFPSALAPSISIKVNEGGEIQLLLNRIRGGKL
ncbi:hypothetical protein EYM_06715 [Ignicoccus islandicus DSM 13165]|uniref:Uncharacterized protein n=1 Tax=Ignicoccus islandicus DSM 13165 TaxID=940295 RepID=A0A0U3DYQ9_9CREN|nr:hypothetical protein EYM_06715 [Ignicoccus islandicus DSM 13165]